MGLLALQKIFVSCTNTKIGHFCLSVMGIKIAFDQNNITTFCSPSRILRRVVLFVSHVSLSVSIVTMCHRNNFQCSPIYVGDCVSVGLSEPHEYMAGQNVRQSVSEQYAR